MARDRASTIAFQATLAATGRGGNMHSRIILGVGILGLMGCGVFGSEDTSATRRRQRRRVTPRPTSDARAACPTRLHRRSARRPPTSSPRSVRRLRRDERYAPTATERRQHPLATIAAGIERVKDLKLRVYVCAGTYDESLTLVNAVSVIGSLGCDGGMWTTGGASQHPERADEPRDPREGHRHTRRASKASTSMRRRAPRCRRIRSGSSPRTRRC